MVLTPDAAIMLSLPHCGHFRSLLTVYKSTKFLILKIVVNSEVVIYGNFEEKSSTRKMLNLFKSQEKNQKRRSKCGGTFRFRCPLKIGQIREILQYAHENPDKSNAEIANFFSKKFGLDIHRLVVEQNLSKREVFAEMSSPVYTNLHYYNNGYHYYLPIKDLTAKEMAALNLDPMSDSVNDAYENPTSPLTINQSSITEEEI